MDHLCTHDRLGKFGGVVMYVREMAGSSDLLDVGQTVVDQSLQSRPRSGQGSLRRVSREKRLSGIRLGKYDYGWHLGWTKLQRKLWRQAEDRASAQKAEKASPRTLPIGIAKTIIDGEPGTYEEQARKFGVNHATIHGIRGNRHENVYIDTIRTLAAHSEALIPADEYLRRYRALVALGHERTDIYAPYMYDLARWIGYIPPEWLDVMRHEYEYLSSYPGQSIKLRRYAARQSWRVPFAWLDVEQGIPADHCDVCVSIVQMRAVRRPGEQLVEMLSGRYSKTVVAYHIKRHLKFTGCDKCQDIDELKDQGYTHVEIAKIMSYSRQGNVGSHLGRCKTNQQQKEGEK